MFFYGQTQIMELFVGDLAGDVESDKSDKYEWKLALKILNSQKSAFQFITENLGWGTESWKQSMILKNYPTKISEVVAGWIFL